MTPDAEDRSVLTRSAPPPDQVIEYGEHADQLIDIYQPFEAPPIGRSPVVFIHGGFWRPAYDRMHARPAAAALANAGWETALPEYRRIPGQPDATVDDILASIQEFLDLIDAHKVTLVGHSAGGHLALLASAILSPTVEHVLALAPVSDLLEAERRGLGDAAVRDFLGTAAAQRPDLNVTQLPVTICPITVLHGVRDSLVPIDMSRKFGERNQVSVIPVHDCGHFELIDPASDAWNIVETSLEK